MVGTWEELEGDQVVEHGDHGGLDPVVGVETRVGAEDHHVENGEEQEEDGGRRGHQVLDQEHLPVPLDVVSEFLQALLVHEQFSNEFLRNSVY